MTSTGIFTQSAASVLQDVEEFYFGGALPWYHGSKLTEDGSHVIVTMEDPEADDESETKDYELSAAQIKEAFREAKQKGYNLCAPPISSPSSWDSAASRTSTSSCRPPATANWSSADTPQARPH